MRQWLVIPKKKKTFTRDSKNKKNHENDEIFTKFAANVEFQMNNGQHEWEMLQIEEKDTTIIMSKMSHMIQLGQQREEE